MYQQIIFANCNDLIMTSLVLIITIYIITTYTMGKNTKDVRRMCNKSVVFALKLLAVAVLGVGQVSFVLYRIAILTRKWFNILGVFDLSKPDTTTTKLNNKSTSTPASRYRWFHKTGFRFANRVHKNAAAETGFG